MRRLWTYACHAVDLLLIRYYRWRNGPDESPGLIQDYCRETWYRWLFRKTEPYEVPE